MPLVKCKECGSHKGLCWKDQKDDIVKCQVCGNENDREKCISRSTPCFVVFDEVHTLSGTSGNLLSHFLSLLQAVSRNYGNKEKFWYLGASATIANQTELLHNLTGYPEDSMEVFPEKNDFEKFLRKPEHENFSIATLLFMILMCGKSPYAVVDGGMCTQNIENSQFPYPFDSHGPKGAPPGPWRKIWSHIPYKSKQAFYNCFANNDRIDGIEWKNIMKNYKRYLEMGADDPQSYLIIPDEYKVLSDEVKAKYNKLF